MKKTLFVLMAAMLVLPLGCKKNNGGESGKDVVMDDPATKELAQVVSFNEPVEFPKIGEVKRIEFSEGSRYIMTYAEKEVVNYSAVKADDEKLHVKVGTFTFKDGVYTLSDAGTIKIDGGGKTVNVTPEGGSEQSVGASVQPTTTGGNTVKANAARTWKLDEIRIKIADKDASVSKSYGPDLQAIAKDIKGKGVKISDDIIKDLAGYTVKEIIITGSGSFVISFTGAEAISGTCDISSTSFKYTLPESSNPIFSSGVATGTIEFGESSAVIAVDVVMNAGNDTYKASFTMTLSEVKQ